MPTLPADPSALRRHRNAKLYRSLSRTLRVYNRLLVDRLHDRGFTDFSAAFPPMLSNLDTEGTHIGVLAMRAGVSRQAAGQLLREIERCGYVKRTASPHDARATIVRFTPRGKKMLTTVLGLVEEIEDDFAAALGARAFDRVREGLLVIADRVDPVGALRDVDTAAPRPRKRDAKG